MQALAQTGTWDPHALVIATGELNSLPILIFFLNYLIYKMAPIGNHRIIES